VPPELEAICVRATMHNPVDRFLSARELHDAVERFLDGDRDLAMRREMAKGHAASAEKAAEEAFAGGEGSEEKRRVALREVGRALALEPENEGAMHVLGRVLMEPPRELPSDAKAALDVARAEQTRLRLRVTAATSAVVVLCWSVFFFWMGPIDWTLFFLSMGLHISSIVVRLVAAGKKRPPTSLNYAGYTLSVLGYTCICRLVGPLFLVPMLLSLHAFVQSMSPDARYRRFVAGLSSIAVLVIVGLEFSGAVSPSYIFQNGVMTILPRLAYLHKIPTVVSLLGVNLFAMVIPTLGIRRMQVSLMEAERRTMLQMWHLRQLLPEQARAPLTPLMRSPSFA
jgi:serine/threonine-protein kinase